MKPSTLLFAAAINALLAVSTTAWPLFHPPHFPFFPPHLPHFPIFPPNPFFPFPPGGGSAPPPSPGSAASVNDSVSDLASTSPTDVEVKKCLKAVHDSGFKSCFRHKYDAGKCCTYITGLEDSCTYVPFYKSHFFHGKLKHVCDGVPTTPTPPSS